MDDYLRRLAYDLGLEEELEAALKRVRANDYEMKFRTESEKSATEPRRNGGASDVASGLMVAFAKE